MFRHYFIVAVRNLLKKKSYSMINIIGLAIGIACCILILLYVQDELSFDQYHENVDQIYRLVLERHAAEKMSLDISTPPPLASALTNDFPQIIHTVRFLNTDNPIPLVNHGDKRFYERHFFFVDPNVFDVFTIPFILGDPNKSLQKPNSIVITEETARKYFGDENPLGKTLTFNNYLDLEVTGVVQNSPSNSTLKFDFLASFSTLYGWLGREFVDNWQNNICQTYLLLSDDFSAKILSRQLPDLIKKYLSEANSLKQIHLQPLNRIHLYSYQDYQLSSGGDIRYIYLLSAVALFILLIGCINFMNLATARSIERFREVGIRKVVGATKNQLVQQFLGETLLSTILALLIAIIMVELCLPYLNTFIESDITVNYRQDLNLWIGLIGIGLFVGFISGVYPAFFLSRFQPIHTLKKRVKIGHSRVSLRQVLIVVQFTLTITLIIGTMVVNDQIYFMQNKKLGFDKDHVIIVPIRDQALRQNPEPLKTQLRQHPYILQVGASALLPGGPVGRTRFRVEAISDEGTMSMLWVDHDFIKTLGIELVAGRDFSNKFQTDATEAVILNEEAIRQLGWTDPDEAIGKSFELVGSKRGRIIGVVKDFNFASLHRKIEPLVLHEWPWLNYILVRVAATHLPNILDDLENTWRKFDPNHPFTYTFLDDKFDQFYQSEKQLGQISGFFSLLAISIACLGLLGLVAFDVEQRTKEIGIRKVLGASITNIVKLFTIGFVKLVFLANLIAWPIAYLVLEDWLQNFAYRIDIGLSTFLLSGTLVLVIALLTISYQSIKAALMNPIKTLRYE